MSMRSADGPLASSMETPPSLPPPPPLGTPPGTPPDSPPDSPRDADHCAPLSPSRSNVPLSARKYQGATLSPRESQSTASTVTLDGSTNDPNKTLQRQEAIDDDFDEFQEIPLDGVVSKSIYKEKRGFLSRLRDASSSKVKNKYAPSDAVIRPANVLAVSPRGPPPSSFTQDIQQPVDNGVQERVEIVLDEEEPIDVAITETTPPVKHDAPEPQVRVPTSPRTVSDRSGYAHKGDDFVDDMAPEVVIHSTESDSESGFATLNPIINRQSYGKRGSVSSAISTGSAIGTNPPVLLSLPIDEDAAASNSGLVLVVNALGATGLAKVEKFGTQSTLLEMRLCESTDDLSSGASHLTFLRTALHKKGGSEAQWNQQFSTALRSKTKQKLYLTVRTHSKLLVGEAMISLAEVGDALYDQHYPIDRMTTEGRRENAGYVHLQLRVIPASQFATVGYSSATKAENRSARASPGPIPAVLRKGALMFKVPYHSHSLMGSAATKRQWVAVSGDGPSETVCITWCDPIDTAEKSRRLDVCLITEVREGAHTKAFERLLQNEPCSVARENDRCFSIVSRTRTLDLVASSKEEALFWIESLRKMIFGDDTQTSNTIEPSKTIEGFRQSAMIEHSSAPSSTNRTTTRKQQLQQWKTSVFDFARRNDIDFIATCLNDGCPIDALETGTGDTLLMLACRLGNARLVELCLQWRAKNDPHPEFGETALQVAVNGGHSECLGLILKTAAESEMDSEIVNHIDSKNDAPLHVAARKGDLACMQLLLHHGADICVVEEFGRTPLHCAVLSGSLECVAYLLDVGGDSVLNAGDHDGDTALHYATLSGGETIVKYLLESAADVQSTNVHGETALEIARREKHGACEKLIAQYHHANATVPSIRNEPASSLLMHHQDCDPVDDDQGSDTMDYNDEEDIDDDDPEAFVEPSNSPVRRGPIDDVYDREYRPEPGYYVPHSARRTSSSSRSTQPISPSARVREVLATQRQRVSMHRCSMPVPPLQFHSARDDLRSRYLVELDYSAPRRQAYTERRDRPPPQYRSYPHSSHSDYENYYHPRERHAHLYDDDRGYSPPVLGNRSQSMGSCSSNGYHQYQQRVYDDYGSWYGPDDHIPAAFRRPNTADAQYSRQYAGWQDSYSQHNPIPVPVPAPPVVPPPPPPPVAPVDLWDTYYSDEGYPYYVSRVTGQSQWESPFESAILSPTTTVAPIVPLSIGSAASTTLSTPSISPDVQVRIRRAAEREITLTKADIDSSELPPEAELSSIPSSPCESPSSKYEVRTGMKLSVDVASPKRQDESRPVYVASPRARSPNKAWSGREAEVADSGFVRSPRASSPRGKSKNIQIIELKRANNLAMALASFKISDRNDQIVQALTTLDERVINAELLVCLQRFFPSEEEAKQLQSYAGAVKNLGPAERFFFLLLQVPHITQRIDCFLYKLQFARSYRSVYAKIQVVKRACRDLIENYSFVQALSEFFKKGNTKSLQTLRSGMHIFRTQFLPRVDEKLHSYHDDLQKASEIELIDTELQINRLLSGARVVQAFVDMTTPPGDRDVAAHDTLHRFLTESRGKLSDLEAEYEGLGQWERKVLDLFGESKASCQLASILECLCSMLEKA